MIGGYERDTLLMIKSYSTAVYCCFEVLEINKSLQDFGITTKWRKEHFLLDQNKTHFRDDQEPVSATSNTWYIIKCVAKTYSNKNFPTITPLSAQPIVYQYKVHS